MKRLASMSVLLSLLSSCAQESAHRDRSGSPRSESELLALVAAPEQDELERALASAGDNRSTLLAAIDEIEAEMRPGMVFLISTMPAHDRAALSKEFLLTNVRLAYDAWRGAPWGSEIDEEMFFQYVLPYANLNERRDDWRADFVQRFQAEAWKHGSRMDAVRWLNDHLNDAVAVHYHASKREKPDQSPYESIELGWASCTGLSILLVDACRAAGIPARCVGCPAWKFVTGNHTWVEVFGEDTSDMGHRGERWFNVGDTGSDPRGENWVNERCRTETDPNDWAHAVYAAAWRPTGRHFPLPWEWEIEYVPALNVTRFYSEPMDRSVTLPRPGPAIIDAGWQGELIARRRVPAGETTTTLRLAQNESIDLVVRYEDGTRESIR